VTDEDNRPLDRLQQVSEVLRVALQSSQRIRKTDCAVALVVQDADDAIEAGGISPGTVDEDTVGGELLPVLSIFPPRLEMARPQPAYIA
jgi:hypothetical protein